MNITEYDEFFKTHNLYSMNYYLTIYQFTEDILIKTLDYYDSPKCLDHQLNLSPYFCFYYLYDKESDSTDCFTGYNDIIEYFNHRNSEYTPDMLYDIFLQTVYAKKNKINIYNQS
jgi:hypothetical protein